MLGLDVGGAFSEHSTANDGPSHKDEFPKQRTQETRGDDQLLTI
jgi:hypothetical protein